jgi:DNA-binding GntR family transcriptional regulator
MAGRADLTINRPRSLTATVAERLRQAIIDGEFALGAAISEEMVANSFGVSRTPVREAMNQLQAQGLVVIRPQVGSFVFTPSADDINALCTFRIALEPKAAELSYRHDRDGAVAAISEAIAAMEPAVNTKDNIAYGRADAAFHEALFAHCGNRYLAESYQLASGRVAALRTNLTSPIDVRTRTSFDEHRRLLDLFARGEFAAFEELMTTHITNSGVVYAKALKVEALKVEASGVE